MNNPNPFVPKGSLLDQQSQRRSRLKLTVFCVLAASVSCLVVMLIQGCKREAPDQTQPPMDTNLPSLDAPTAPPADTNLSAQMPPPPMAQSNYVSSPVPQMPPPPLPITQPPVAPQPDMSAGTDYVIVSGDTLAKIAKSHGVSLKALEAANPGVDPKKLKINKKITIPAPTVKASDATTTSSATSTGDTSAAGGETYTVKSGDTLSKIARHHGVSLKSLKAANNLTTDHIKVGDKLVIPAKADTGTTTSAPAVDTSATMPPSAPAPGTAPAMSAPAMPAPAPAPAH